MADRTPSPFLDTDTTDAYLDLAEPRYAPHGKPASLADTDRRLAEAAAGGRPLPKLPPPVER